ncbi:MAG TPA: arylamine N-acetyltransferase [Opitutaceae bacterium]|nr:arylamine N-acetyltransferase [Opitutaceae bacterium]
MPSASSDLESYFARLGYTGPRTPTLATLRALQFAHVCAVPFENLDVLLGRGIRIDLPSIEEKIVRQKRGGYCFEQNTLFAAVLRALGFAVTPLSARVRWQVPADVGTPLTHMLLLVEAEGRRFIADVGFGSMSLTGPLLLDTEDEQPTPHEARRLVRRGPLVVHQARLGEEWSDVYQFTLEPQSPIDYELANWFTSTHPQSRFVQNLTAARVEPGLRHTILNHEFTTRHVDGRIAKRTLADADELLAVLAEYFHLSFPAGTRFGSPGASWPV